MVLADRLLFLAELFALVFVAAVFQWKPAFVRLANFVPQPELPAALPSSPKQLQADYPEFLALPVLDQVLMLVFLVLLELVPELVLLLVLVLLV